ncbi:alpha-L-rhamnosidase [Microbacterium resistens]|uniref:alpha-L-rhamnosidase n=1 Tax=Microbacterium resistens TaxID=156977 RepID=A0ABU1SCX3_9MICO|nr:family 78 glycoside hydrolase catalytic domain [Microbacterium resistens]MDR6867450.1 alpha-L-rhamnosidase [Microbacterium resistens]
MIPPWTAALISAPDVEGAPILRRRFEVPADRGAVTSARLLVTAQGIVEPSLDGSRIGRDVLSPGWSAYETRLRVVEHDLTELLRAGTHELALLLGRGWYSGRLGWMGAEGVYGDRPAASAVLRVRFADGSEWALGTDAEWTASSSGVLADDLYDGQIIDARHESTDRNPVAVEALDPSRLVAYHGPLVVRHERVAPVRRWRSPRGTLLLDFGQNLVGWLRIAARGPRGRALTIRHAEVIEDGELATRPLRTAQATDRFVLSGGEDAFEPSLTFHGFRYAEIDGWDETEVVGTVEAVVVGSDLRRIGHFSCSDALLSRFHENVVWSLRGNTVALPTDCPQRDERLGWTGDIAVFAPTACFLFDMTGFLRDWLADLRAEQSAAGGRVPYVIPDALKGWAVREGEDPESVGVWSDAAVWVPWAIWEASGERAVLEESYDSMRAHVDRVAGRLSARGVWEGDFQFGDWLDPTAPPDDPFAAVADPDVIATAAYCRSLELTARTARVLGCEDEAVALGERAERARAAFAAVYLLPDGTLRSDAPAVYALAIAFDLLDDEARDRAGARLAGLVRASGHTINAGFAGAPYLCEALTRTGNIADAYALLMNRTHPSWLRPVELGATTVWERWDSLQDDGHVNPGEMTSFNHYALGAVADWMHRVIGGIETVEPGYARVRIDPRPGGGLSWARTVIDTPHGPVGVAWTAEPELRVEYWAPDGVEIELGEGIVDHAVRLPGPPAPVRAALRNPARAVKN